MYPRGARREESSQSVKSDVSSYRGRDREGTSTGMYGTRYRAVTDFLAGL